MEESRLHGFAAGAEAVVLPLVIPMLAPSASFISTAGLGGGMGPFLVEPLLEELQTVAESPAPLHDGRRLLEVHIHLSASAHAGLSILMLQVDCAALHFLLLHQVIVPLVYRPAIKSAMLTVPFTSTLAQLLGAPAVL